MASSLDPVGVAVRPNPDQGVVRHGSRLTIFLPSRRTDPGATR